MGKSKAVCVWKEKSGEQKKQNENYDTIKFINNPNLSIFPANKFYDDNFFGKLETRTILPSRSAFWVSMRFMSCGKYTIFSERIWAKRAEWKKVKQIQYGRSRAKSSRIAYATWLKHRKVFRRCMCTSFEYVAWSLRIFDRKSRKMSSDLSSLRWWFLASCFNWTCIILLCAVEDTRMRLIVILHAVTSVTVSSRVTHVPLQP